MTQAAFQDWLHANGFTLPQVILDGKIHRFAHDGGRDNGWMIGWLKTYVKTGDDYIVAVVGDWRNPGVVYEYRPSGKSISKEDRANMAAQFKKAAAAAEEERRQGYIIAAQNAERGFARAKTAMQPLPYLVKKQINQLYGARIALFDTGSTLVVPLRDIDGKLAGVQQIGLDYKRFSKGMQVKGNMFVFGELNDTTADVFLCEGWATAASVHMATGRPTVAAFDAGNLLPVGLAIKARYPQLGITVAGDDDRFKNTNTGKDKGQQAAIGVLGALILPVFDSDEGEPTDWNDLYVRQGPEAVRQQLIPEVPPEPETGFIPLGLCGGDASAYYYEVMTRTILKIPASCSNRQLYALAPEAYWEARYPGAKGAGANYNTAASDLLHMSKKIGMFETSRLRGNGVWRDEDRIIVNTGKTILVDGTVTPMAALKSQHVYINSGKELLPIMHKHPLNADEGHLLLEACQGFSWVEDDYGKLLAGWLAIARISGAMPYRPHIWITGQKGTGKSTVLINKLVKPILGRGKLFFQGSTTEPGIRQPLGGSRIPIIFDEFDVTGDFTHQRFAAIIDLLRNTWSETEGRISKGTAGGNSIDYQLGFSALLASIRVSLSNDADRSRFSILELRPHGGDLDKAHHLFGLLARVGGDYGERLFARSVTKFHTIIATQAVFEFAFARLTGDFRVGQQVGSLLAGWWSIFNDAVPTQAEAENVVRNLQLKGEMSDAADCDEVDCLTHLLTTKVSLTSSQSGSRQDLSIEEAIENKEWHNALKTYGIRVSRGYIIIADKHAELAKFYRDTRWANQWARAFCRIEGAERIERTTFGSAHVKARGVSIPFCAALADYRALHPI